MATTNRIDYIRPELQARLQQYKLIDDCLEGEHAIKAAGDVYLPRPNPDDTSKENKARYASYLARAVFYNVARRTWRDLASQAFQRDFVCELDSLLAPLLASADGTSCTLEQQAKRANGITLGKGRCGLLADFPALDGPVSRLDLLSGAVAPTITLYDPAQIINWRTKRMGSRSVPVLIVLHEMEAVDDGYAITYEPRWRELRLVDGKYTVTVYGPPAEGSSEHTIVHPTRVVMDANKNPIGQLLFHFVGAENNDDAIDSPPLYDICSLNVAHYRNSADWEESCYQLGQPTPKVTGLTEDWYNRILGKKIAFGSRGGVPLPVGGDLELVQPDPNTMAAAGMADKEQRMVALGAKLLEQKQVAQTASEVRINYASELSIVGTVARNVAQAYQTVLDWCGLFVGATKPAVFTLGVDFGLGRLTSDELRALSDLHAKSDITDSEWRELLVKAGIASLSLEDYQAEIASKPTYALPAIAASPAAAITTDKGE